MRPYSPSVRANWKQAEGGIVATVNSNNRKPRTAPGTDPTRDDGFIMKVGSTLRFVAYDSLK